MKRLMKLVLAVLVGLPALSLTQTLKAQIGIKSEPTSPIVMYDDEASTAIPDIKLWAGKEDDDGKISSPYSSWGTSNSDYYYKYTVYDGNNNVKKKCYGILLPV